MPFISRKLGRTPSHRVALFKNLTRSLIEHERIKTTIPKAKELRRFADYMVTLGKKGSLTHRRRANDWLKSKLLVDKLFSTLTERYKNRHGGYTRIVRLTNRRRFDNSQMCYIEYIDNLLPWQFSEVRLPRNYLSIIEAEKKRESPVTTLNDLD